MTIQHMFFAAAAALAVLGWRADAFYSATLPPRCSSRAQMAVSASPAGGGGESGLSRAEAIQRAAAVSGVVLLGAEAACAEAGAEMKDEVEQFAELRGQVEKKGRDEVVSRGPFDALHCSCRLGGGLATHASRSTAVGAHGPTSFGSSTSTHSVSVFHVHQSFAGG